MNCHIELLNLSFSEDIIPYETYDFKLLEMRKNSICVPENKIENKFIGSTFLKNAMPVYSLVKEWDLFSLAADASIIFKTDIPENAENSIRYIGFRGGNEEFLFTPNPCFPDRTETLRIKSEDRNKYRISKKRTVYIADFSEKEYIKVDTPEIFEYLPCKNGQYTDDYEKVKILVDKKLIPTSFIEGWDSLHSVFHVF